MNTTDISALLSEAGAQYIKQNGAIAYLKHFFSIVNDRLKANTITATAANVACARAEALATYIAE